MTANIIDIFGNVRTIPVLQYLNGVHVPQNSYQNNHGIEDGNLTFAIVLHKQKRIINVNAFSLEHSL